MCKQITSKVTLILLVLGVMSNSFKSQASPVFEVSKASAKPNQTNKHNLFSPTSKDAEDIVVDEVIYFNSSSTSCTVSSILKKYAGESMPISVGSSTWRAKFAVGGQFAEIALSYNVQSDHLSFSKTLSSNITYSVDPNGEFIHFYLNGSPFFSIADMKTCNAEMCGSLEFYMDNTVVSLYTCNSGGGSNSFVAKNGSTTQATHTYQQLDVTTGVDIAKKGLTKTLITTQAASPNPFTNNVTIRYNLMTDAHVNVTVYNSVGQVVDVLVNQNQAKGINSIDWEKAGEMKAGLYFYEIKANNERMVGKLIKQ
jgi:hypothetical protein